MRFLQVGLGSMGKRRIRNLLKNSVKKENIAGFDLSVDRCLEVEKAFKLQTYRDFHTAIKIWKPDVFIISTPPNLHAQYFLYAAEQNKHFFVEVATSDDGYATLLEKIEHNTCIAAPSCNMRYFYPIKTIKKIIEKGVLGKIHAFTHHMGMYLPDWHPWEDYRKFYVSQKDSGACKEMVPYELSWIQWVLNDEIIEAKGIIGKCSDLEIKADDVYAAVLRSKMGIIGTLLVDVVSRAPFRTFRILGSKSVLEWHWVERKLRIYNVRTKKWKTYILPQGKKIQGYLTTTEEMYEEEIKTFLDAIHGKKIYPYSFAEDFRNLQLLKKIEKVDRKD